ncbi:hypothetical protein NLI96_g8221 [Meripilus lineatus]|uniref:Protein kinase domain-containing protein n=1 Tax=Meripilus lineatus TaxID=2056292 RepID=A0AAD5YBA7_9APHY|nr:hypothetical protein NLI96_g8221 [Physisporinus lineatus]
MPQQTSSAILGITSLLMNVANPQAYLVDPRAPIGNYGIRAGITAFLRSLLHPVGGDGKRNDATEVEAKRSSQEPPAADLSLMVAGILRDPGNNFPPEVQGVLAILLSAFEEHNDSSIRDLTGDNAQLAVDVMQEVISAEHYEVESTNYNSGRSQRTDIATKKIAWSVAAIRKDPGLLPLAERTCNEEQIALKRLRVFNSNVPTERRVRERSFYRETVLWYNVSHPHVLPFKGVTDIPGIGLCMVSPWMPNGNVRTYLQGLVEHGLSGKGYVDVVNKMLYDIALGLNYLHTEDIVHGDLRGPNVLVDGDGTLRLTDFGLSVIADVGLSYTSLNAGGAVGYASPELIEAGDPRPTIASDVYAFGHVCVELYSRLPPYHGCLERQIPLKIIKGEKPPRPSTKGQEMNDTMWNLVTKCWSADARPPMEEVLSILKGQCGL